MNDKPTERPETPLQALARLAATIGEIQLRLAQADADRAETARLDAEEFGERVRWTLDD